MLESLFNKVSGLTPILKNIYQRLLLHCTRTAHCFLSILLYALFLYKQPVHKQLAFAWQIAKQLSGLKPLSLSNNKNYRLKKNGVFPLQ